MSTSNDSKPMSSAMPKVAVIVLTWNRKSLTLDCLESLVSLEYDNVDLIVVDNASTDGTATAIREGYGDRVTIIENDRNLGFAVGNNIGIRRALDGGADYVLLLNNDTVVDPGLLDHLVAAAAESPEVGIVGPKIFFASPPDRIWFAGGEVSLARGTSRHIGIRQTDRGQFEETRVVDYITGCALMAARAVFETVGDLDPVFVAYYEDVDFCMRARQKGYRVVYVPAGKVWHRISASTGGQLGAAKIRRKLRSTLIFFRRYASPHHWLTIPLFFAVDALRIFFLVGTGRIHDTKNQEKARGSES